MKKKRWLEWEKDSPQGEEESARYEGAKKRIELSHNENFSAEKNIIRIDTSGHAEYEEKKQREKLRAQAQFMVRKEKLLKELSQFQSPTEAEPVPEKGNGIRWTKVGLRLTYALGLIGLGLRGLFHLVYLYWNNPVRGVDWRGGLMALVLFLALPYGIRLWKKFREIEADQTHGFYQRHPNLNAQRVKYLRFLCEGSLLAGYACLTFLILTSINIFLYPATLLLVFSYMVLGYCLVRILIEDVIRP